MFSVQVSLIVMLTKLEEKDDKGKSKRKAEKYWPELDQPSLKLARSHIRVEQLPHRRSEQGGYVYRRDIAGLCSHWSSSYITALSLVESFIVMLRQLSYAIKNQL